MNYATEAKATLQAALDSLLKHGQPEHAAAAEAAIQAAGTAGDLLESDLTHAKQAVARWHAGMATEAKLDRALKNGTSAHMLGRAIQVNLLDAYACLSTPPPPPPPPPIPVPIALMP